MAATLQSPRKVAASCLLLHTGCKFAWHLVAAVSIICLSLLYSKHRGIAFFLSMGEALKRDQHRRRMRGPLKFTAAPDVEAKHTNLQRYWQVHGHCKCSRKKMIAL